MGKHSKRRRRNNSNNTNKKNNKKDEKEDSKEKENGLLQRLRHGDAHTRHAALTALLHHLQQQQQSSLEEDNGSSSSKKQEQKLLKSSLLQGIRERIMDSDLECATVAAHCLNQYISSSSSFNNNNTDEQQVMSGWALVLLQRLQSSHDYFIQAQQGDDNDKNDNNKKNGQWLAVTLASLSALCTMIETGILSSSQTPVLSIHKDMMKLLIQFLQLLQTWSSALENDKDNNNEQQQQQQYLQIKMDIAIQTTRCLHSALDDNLPLLEHVLENNNDNQQFMSLLQQSIIIQQQPSNNNNINENQDDMMIETTNSTDKKKKLKKTLSFPPRLAQLHSCGILVATFNNTEAVATIQKVVTLLQSEIQHHDDCIQKELIQNVVSTYETLKKELQDEAMEKDIIQKVNKRREPARHIARRQAAMKKQKEEQEDNDAKMSIITNDNDTKQQDKNDDNQDKKKENEDNNNKMMTNEDAYELHQDALQTFCNEFTTPLELSLEITANLLSTLHHNDDNDDMEMDNDDDDQKDNDIIVSAISSSELSVALLGRLQHLMECILLSTTTTPMPNVIYSHLTSLVQKSCACLLNLVTAAPLQEFLEKEKTINKNIWTILVNQCQRLLTTTTTEARLDCCQKSIKAMAKVMVGLFQNYESIRTQLQPCDLDFILSTMLNNNNNCRVEKEGIEMLGIVCSQQTHDKSMNESICKALLQVGRQQEQQQVKKNDNKRQRQHAIVIINEVLNALMDIYGNDENHPNVFESLNVLQFFQSTIPTFQNMIRTASKDKVSNDDDDDDDMEMSHHVDEWEETAYNAGQFVAYKKGQTL